jgi:hypothetical protein
LTLFYFFFTFSKQTAGTDAVFGLLLNLCSAAGNIFMIFLTITAMACFQTKLKKMRGNLAFSDPDGMSQWPDPNTLPDWDLDVERKRLMWKPFWDRIMEKDTDLAGLPAEEEEEEKSKEGESKEESSKKKKKKKARRMSLVKAPDGTAVPFASQRFEESKEKLRLRGFDAWENAMTPDASQLPTKNDLQLQWEGLDIFCDDSWRCDAGCSIAKDGKMSSVNGFGRLEIDPFPFCAKIFWDGSGKDLGEIPSWNEHSPRLTELLQMQTRPDVVRMREIRAALRGCARSREKFFLWKERDEEKTRKVDDGKDVRY